MKSLLGMLVLVTLLVGGVFFDSARAQELNQPNCAELEQWASQHESAGMLQIAPKVEVTGLLGEPLVKPLFGQSLMSWEGSALNTIRGWLNDCRRTANKRHDKKASNNLYQAMKAIASARAPLLRMDRVREASAQRVQKLIAYPPAPKMADVIALAQEALRGEDVRTRARGIRLPGGIVHEAIGLQQAAEYLPTDEIEPMIARLQAHRVTLEGKAQDIAVDFEAAKRQLESVPMSQEGLDTLDRLAKLPVLENVSRDEAALFRRALIQKRNEVTRSMQAQRAAEWRAAQKARQKRAAQAAAKRAQPVDVQQRLASVIGGKSFADVSLLGFKPGVKHSQAVRYVQRHWGFERQPSLDPGEHYGANRQDRSKLRKTAGRDGGTIIFRTMDDAVGQVRFVEYYMGPVDAGATREWLKSRFGTPTKEQSTSDGRFMSWSDGSVRIQAEAVNRVENYAQHAGYVSKLAFALWSADFESYKVAEKERCDAIRNKPTGELSIADKSWFTVHCLMGE